MAGIFATFSSLAVLNLLGVAIGLSSVDADDRPSSFGIGAGIWGIVSALAAFFIGGWVAAWSGREGGERHGILQGVMVWAVAIPLSLYLAATVAGAATRAVGSAMQTGSNLANAAAQDPQAREQARSLTTQASDEATSDRLQQARDSITPDRVEDAAGTAAKTAWGLLAATLLGLGAAAAGGFVGGKSNDDDFNRRSVRD